MAQIDKKERSDLILGICVVALVMALFGWLIVRAGRLFAGTSAQPSGKIAASGPCVRGQAVQIEYLPEGDISNGAEIMWTVDGQQVQQSVYKQGQSIALEYTPQQAGEHTVTVQAGRHRQTLLLEAELPRLTLTAPNITVVYGDKLPQLRCSAEGFVAQEGENFSTDRCRLPQGRLDVGVHDIEIDCEDVEGYDIEQVRGTLTVLPRQLTVDSVPSKTYDGTGVLENPELKICGTLDGDDVRAVCDKLYFDNKNVGSNKQIMLSCVELQGEDAANYSLPDFAVGQILPRELRLEGLTVQNKVFDGTTKAAIDKMGSLVGVCSGDSVAIGRVELSFDSAEVGVHGVNVSSIALVGPDKDNYALTSVEQPSAEIEAKGSLWDRMFGEPLAQTK